MIWNNIYQINFVKCEICFTTEAESVKKSILIILKIINITINHTKYKGQRNVKNNILLSF